MEQRITSVAKGIADGVGFSVAWGVFVGLIIVMM